MFEAGFFLIESGELCFGFDVFIDFGCSEVSVLWFSPV